MTQNELRYRLSPARIVTLSALSFGVYLYYWFYTTWKQYREQTGEPVYPVWHALAVSVPIYGYFRAHAHMRALEDLMSRGGVRSLISPGRAVLAVIVVSIAMMVASIPPLLAEPSSSAGVTVLLSSAVSAAVCAVLLLRAQESLNRYWDGLGNVSAEGPAIGVGEVILALLGTIQWVLGLVLLLNPP